jgi:predicted deacetylase
MRRLLLSIHDVGPRFETEVDLLLERVTRHVAPTHLAMLVVPDHWGEHPLTPGAPFTARLRAWSDMGISLFAHGWFHKDMTVHRGVMARFKGKHMTAGEGEFLGLDEATALARMVAGRDLIQTITGRPVSGFVAPAWLYGPGAMAALARSDFALAEDHMKVWHPASGRVLARGPVITWASRSPARIASSLFAARILPPMLRFAPVVRVAVHPGDVTISDLLVSIDDTLRRLCRTHRPARYDDLHPAETALAHPYLPAQL